ncbi:hypothetical protein HOD38_03370 [archaeon]|jgi:hypothetical protein|nr:hypothetical protein [archaeon]MBT4397280.1 hypothetical protein [archaeon]MBT4440660.1 hypothetical protein [archaeon]
MEEHSVIRPRFPELSKKPGTQHRYFSPGSPQLSRDKITKLLLNQNLWQFPSIVLPAILFREGIRRQLFNGQTTIPLGHKLSIDSRIREFKELIAPLLEAIGCPYDFTAKVWQMERSQYRLETSLYAGRSKFSNKDMKRFGNEMHFPTCCIRQYEKNFSAGTPPSLQFDSRLRYFPEESLQAMTELAYLLHVPCSPFCQDTFTQIRGYHDLTRRLYPAVAEKFEPIILESITDSVYPKSSPELEQ